MPESLVPGLFRVRIEWTGFLGVSGSLFNVLHYLDTDVPQHDYTNQAVADTLAAAVEDFWDTVGTGGSAALRTLYDQGQPATVYARNLNKDLVEASAATGALAGTAASEQMPAEVSAVISLATNTAGKSYRGRVYLPPPAINQSTAGFITAGFVTNAKAAFDTWMRPQVGNVLQLADLDLCVYSRTLDDATLVTQTRMNNTWDTQRGRGMR